MGKARCTKIALLGFVVLLSGVARAADTVTYKMITKDRVFFGTPVDDKHFRGCNNMTIERPQGARVERSNTPCPSNDDLVPFSGHAKLVRPKPKGTPHG